MKYISSIGLILAITLSVAVPTAEATSNTVAPLVSSITNTSATVSVPAEAVSVLTADQKASLYFEYGETNQVCIMIYPTPENCLLKRTAKGNLSATLSGLKPHTSYTVSYKVDNTIACITAPCPNGVESNKTEFVTAAGAATSTTFSRNLMYGSRGNDVAMLQDILRTKGYLHVASTGYFGLLTLKAVYAFQKNEMRIVPTGFVGPLTRSFLNSNSSASDEVYFEGVIQAASTSCYADGICSVTIDGKVIVTTMGWTGGALGSIKGSVTNIGDVANSKIGARAKVYAKKTSDGYTLYGNTKYYIEVQ